LDAGVVRDTLVRLPGSRRLVRFVLVRVAPHPRRTRTGTKRSDLILLATSLLMLPAELVALVYRYRYTVELFFRVLKQLPGMRGTCSASAGRASTSRSSAR